MTVRVGGWRKLWHDPVWSKVIAGGITVALAGVATYFLDWWPDIAKGVRGTWRFLFQSSPVPHWLIGLLALLSLGLIVRVVVAFWRNLQTSPEPWRRYTSDEFFGLRWRWSYSGGMLSDLHPFCPHCDYLLISEQLGYAGAPGMGFRCDSCGQQLPTFQEPIDHIKSKVGRLIIQKLRNGTWAVASPR